MELFACNLYGHKCNIIEQKHSDKPILYIYKFMIEYIYIFKLMNSKIIYYPRTMNTSRLKTN